MKRDDDCIRELLFEAEREPDSRIIAAGCDGMTDEEQKRHVHALLLSDAGLFEVSPCRSVFRLTSQGHDYLAAIRDDTLWRSAKTQAAKIGGVTLDIMKDIAVALLRREAAELTGLPL